MKPKYKGFGSNTDITFCTNDTCRIRHTCMHSLSNYEFGPDEYVSIFSPEQMLDLNYGCAHYWEVIE